jgi:hypothetical protein
MSLQALVWAFDLDLRPATTKFVLVALADYASDENLCFPSVQTLCDKTCLDRKTVLRALERLEELLLIRDTQKRCGSTKQVKIYVINPNSPKNGTVSGGQKDTKGPVFPIEQSRFSVEESQKRDTEPLINRTEGTLSTPAIAGGGRKGSERKEKEERANSIYQLYPRKQARAQAIKAIMRALAKVPFEELRAKTLAFAEAWGSAPRDELQYCPYPATWYNAESYNDDPALWRRTFRREHLGPLHVQIDALEKAVGKHPCNPNSTLYDEEKITPALREGYKSLKSKLEQLKQQHTQAILAA